MSLCKIHTIQRSSKWKVQCMAMYYNLILMGCNDSIIRIFAPFQRTKNINSIEYQCIKEVKLAGKFIKQLEIVEYVDLLIVIIDENCIFYSLYTPYELGNPFLSSDTIKFNVCKLFVADAYGGGAAILSCSKAWSDGLQKKLFIAFGTKKEISVFQWKGMVASNLNNITEGQTLKKYNSYEIPVQPSMLIFAGKTLIIGFKKQYDLLHLEYAARNKIFATGTRSNRPIGVKVINKEILLAVDNKGYFVDYDAKPTRSKCIYWSDIPSNISYFHPYIIAILPKCVEIHHLLTSNCIHKIDFIIFSEMVVACEQCLAV